MPPIPFADNFLAGSLLSLLMPVCLLIALAVWYVVTVRRVPGDTPTPSATLPAPDVVPAAAEAPSEVKPAGSPPGDIR
jgi:hypothetical protein